MTGKSNKTWKHLHNVSSCENHGLAMTLNDCDGEHIINPKYIKVFNIVSPQPIITHIFFLMIKITFPYTFSSLSFIHLFCCMDLNPNTDITYNEKLDNHISGRIPENIFFTIPLMSSQYVLQQLATLDISKAAGLDNISAKFLKMSSHLTLLYYVSFVNITLYLMDAATITPVVVTPVVKG
jgi:hypothetical protein